MSNEPIVIVGAGQCGIKATETLRQLGYDGDLVLIGEEPHAPYQRPPLSKAFLTELTSYRSQSFQRRVSMNRPAVAVHLGRSTSNALPP